MTPILTSSQPGGSFSLPRPKVASDDPPPPPSSGGLPAVGISSILELTPQRYWNQTSLLGITNGQGIPQWDDAANGWHATMATAFNRPLKQTRNGVAVAEFNVDRYFSYNQVSPLDKYTVMALIRLTADRTQDFFLTQWDPSGAAIGFGVGSSAPCINCPWAFNAAGGQQYFVPTLARMSNNAFHVVTFKRYVRPVDPVGLCIEAYLDGQYCGWVAAPNATGATSNGFIGLASWDSTLKWLDDIAEIAIWNRDLTTLEQDQAECLMGRVAGLEFGVFAP